MIQAIQDPFCRQSEVHIRHVFQEGNALADFMTSKGFSLEEEFLSSGVPPAGACYLSMTDVMGVCFSRIIRL